MRKIFVIKMKPDYDTTTIVEKPDSLISDTVDKKIIPDIKSYTTQVS